MSEVLGGPYANTVIAEDQYRPPTRPASGTQTPARGDEHDASASPAADQGDAVVDPLIDYATRELGAVATRLMTNE